MALSTNIPMAIMMAASDIRWSAMPRHHDNESGEDGKNQSATYQRAILEPDEK